MDNLTRLQYLDAMGIDVWIPKGTQKNAEPSSINQIDGNIENEVEYQTTPDVEQWSSLKKQVEECQQCDLCRSRIQTIIGIGNYKAECLVIGEAPKESETLEGKAFGGQAGLLLTEMIRAIGFHKEDVYITNVIKCSTPNDRDPHVEETKACYAYLQRQILLIKPKVILVLGRIAAQSLLNSKEPLSKLRGVPHQLNGIPLIVVYHPRYLLRSLLEKRKAWQDLQLAIEQLKK